MTIALPLTPNRDAFTPKLALFYSSGAGNGVFGMGWSLGLAAIQRKTDRGLPRYLAEPDEDVFVIAGSEDLVPRLCEGAPGNWQPVESLAGGRRVGRYVPRIAGDFARIERVDDSMRGTWWKVTDRSDMVTVYGRSREARVADPADPERIFQWLPEFSYDNRGNLIVYGYRAENSAGMPATCNEEMRQGLAKTGLHVLAQLRRDDFDAWHALKTTGSAMLTLGLERLLYFAQNLERRTLGAMTVLAKVDGDPAAPAVTVDGANVSLNFDPVFKLNLNDHSGPELGVPFALAVPAASLAALTDIALVVKVNFA